MKENAGSRVVILLIIAIAFAAMVGTCVAADGNDYTEQQLVQLRMPWLYDILLRGAQAKGIAVDDSLSCISSGQSCRFSFDENKDQCCPGSRCTGQGPLSSEFACEWCPGEGATCGALHHCCPRIHCVGGPFNGKCMKN